MQSSMFNFFQVYIFSASSYGSLKYLMFMKIISYEMMEKKLLQDNSYISLCYTTHPYCLPVLYMLLLLSC